ncbi:SAV_2336 family protein [Streptomyces scopuliridis]|uniref:SAV_2336 family protein n=1 Tax=Streptomyces scopuliridis TaxID=452529 RepID=A0ACD4ZFF6_9ACTN|nr:SAV_2336 N-terminal domain-related protein [Streptomyces scopuliridis]WSB97047.1 SAV_2336 family protein [Streptomyces scopuliridis]WSC09249.1 SAV_2336 family protein [Streptomyces scopuliridis]
MTSDRALSGPAALREVLTAAGGDPPTGRELAEVLWLATHVRPEPEPDAEPEAAAGAGPEDGPRPPQRGPAQRATISHDASPRGMDPLRTPPGGAVPDPGSEDTPFVHSPGGRVVLHRLAPPPVTGPAPPPPGPDARAEVLAPAPPMISHPLAVQRALRPLRRTVPSARERELDETGTAHRIASLGARPGRWLPELRPAPERWLHLRLVLDCGPTMAMWQPLARDLYTAFGQTGAFRTVELVRLGADGSVPPRQWTAGRTMVLILSDMMGPQWRPGPTGAAGAAGRQWYRTLRRWTRELPVAVVQPLPERMWRHTPPAPVPGLFTAAGPGAPNTALRFTPYDGEARGVPVPVLEPAPEWLGHWAGLVASPAGAEFPGAAALLAEGPPAGPSVTLPEEEGDGLIPRNVPARELVLRFRSVASPQAVRLAAHLAVGPPHLPVMRLVQAAIEERPQPQHLAEVVLSGMLTAVPGPAGSYDFRPGVRELLLGALPRTGLAHTVNLLERVGAVIESRAGSARGEFRALLAGDGPAGFGRAAGEPFALVSRESVRLLRGPEPEPVSENGERVLVGRYRLVEVIERGTHGVVWRAYDRFRDRERDRGRTVAVKIFGHPGATRDSLLAMARSEHESTAVLRRPGVVKVREHGTDGDVVYLVSEALEGSTLGELLAENGHRPLPVTEVTGIAAQVIDVLSYARERGVRPEPPSLTNIIRLPDGAVKLRGFGAALPDDETYDELHALGRVLYELATGAEPFGAAHAWRPPRELRPDLPAALESAIVDLLFDAPESRRRGADALRSSGVPGSTWQYGVLGPLRAMHSGRDRTPASYEARLVLSRLLLARGQSVSKYELWRALGFSLWNETGVADLIDVLLDDGHAVEGPEGNYRLRLDTELDLSVAEQLAADALRAEEAGETRRAAGLYEAALGHWYGEPLDGIEGAWADRERDQLNALRRSLETARYALAEPRTASPPEAEAPREAASEPETAAPPEAPPQAVQGDDVHLAIGGAELFGVPRDTRAEATLFFLPRLRQACREAFGDAGIFEQHGTVMVPDTTLRVTAGPEYTLAQVLDRFIDPFAPILTEGMTSWLFPLPVVLTVHLHHGPPDATALELEGKSPALGKVGGLGTGKIALLLGLRDELYRRIGAPEGYRPFDRETEDGTTHVVWYRVIHYAPPKPTRRPRRTRRPPRGRNSAD